jgi:hypothetical protein
MLQHRSQNEDAQERGKVRAVRPMGVEIGHEPGEGQTAEQRDRLQFAPERLFEADRGAVAADGQRALDDGR